MRQDRRDVVGDDRGRPNGVRPTETTVSRFTCRGNHHGVHLRLRRRLLTSLAAILRMTSATSQRAGQPHARGAGTLRPPAAAGKGAFCDVMYSIYSMGKLRLDAGSQGPGRRAFRCR